MKRVSVALALIVTLPAMGQPQPQGAETRDQVKNTAASAPTQLPEKGDGKGLPAEEGTEYWSILGLHLKITDTLLTAFTFLLFLATLALWLATRNLVSGADKNAERQLRAYIFTRVANSNCTKALSEVARVEYAVFNKGNTPGTIVEMVRKVECLPYPLTRSSNLNPGTPQSIGAIIGADDVESRGLMNANSPFSSSEIYEMQANPPTKRVYFHGYFTYQDVFGKTRETRFCYSLVYDSITPNGATWEPTDGFNSFT